MKKRNTIFSPFFAAGLSSLLVLAGCGQSGGLSDTEKVARNSTSCNDSVDYDFCDSEGNSTVYYTGQNARQLLVSQVKSKASSLTIRDASIDEQTVIDSLNFYINLDASTRDASLTQEFPQFNGVNVRVDDDEVISSGVNALDISSGKTINSKLAGNDNDLLADGTFYTGAMVSDAETDISTPENLLQALVSSLAEEVTTEGETVIVSGTGAVAIDGNVSASGHDYAQLLQKYLLGALTFDQGTADYLSTDWESKFTSQGGAYVTHKFDEGWGYFGGARDYGQLTDTEIKYGEDLAKDGGDDHWNDSNSDGDYDVRSEYNFGNSVNCAKRDLGGQKNTDFTGEAFDAFHTARGVLQVGMDNGDVLTAYQAELLEDQITIAAQTWEKCIAATVVHYINDVIVDMSNFESDGFTDLDNFKDLAKHWGEMYGFALGLQFSPYSPFRNGGTITDGQVVAAVVSDVDIDDLQAVLVAMGTAPVLWDGTMDDEAYTGGTAAYVTALEGARDTLRDAYGFSQAQAASW